MIQTSAGPELWVDYASTSGIGIKVDVKLKACLGQFELSDSPKNSDKTMISIILLTRTVVVNV